MDSSTPTSLLPNMKKSLRGSGVLEDADVDNVNGVFRACSNSLSLPISGIRH